MPIAHQSLAPFFAEINRSRATERMCVAWRSGAGRATCALALAPAPEGAVEAVASTSSPRPLHSPSAAAVVMSDAWLIDTGSVRARRTAAPHTCPHTPNPKPKCACPLVREKGHQTNAGGEFYVLGAKGARTQGRESRGGANTRFGSQEPLPKIHPYTLVWGGWTCTLHLYV